MRELIMGLSAPIPPRDDPHAGAAWADTPADVVLEQAQRAAAGGDVPRARELVDSVLNRSGLSAGEQLDAWEIALEVGVLEGDVAAAEEAVGQLAARAPIGAVRQRIRMTFLRHPGDVDLENRLLQRAEEAASSGVAPTTSGMGEDAAGQAGGAAPVPDDARVHYLDPTTPSGPPGSIVPAPSLRALLEKLQVAGEDDDAAAEEDPGAPDPESLRLFTEG
ncbi:MAG TPA: hypothetical protein VFR37_18415, partial [Longimicrobium sp.]|nr:hypothetical protein [Longimicrobium sp.]